MEDDIYLCIYLCMIRLSVQMLSKCDTAGGMLVVVRRIQQVKSLVAASKVVSSSDMKYIRVLMMTYMYIYVYIHIYDSMINTNVE